MKRVHPLSDKEILALNEGFKKGSHPAYRNRCKIILLSNENLSVRQISEQLQNVKDTVYFVLKKYESEGIYGLQNTKGQGRISVLDNLTEEQLDRFKKTVDKHPQNLNKVSTLLSKKFGLKISKRMLIEFLKKNSITPIAE